MGMNNVAPATSVPGADAITLPSPHCTRRSFLTGSLLCFGSTLRRTTLRQAVAAAATPNASPSNLDFASALEAARAVHRGAVYSVELTARLLERIERFNPPLNAIVTLTPDAVLAPGPRR